MPRKDQGFKKTVSSLNSPWLANVLKSMGMASQDVIKSMVPATAATLGSASSIAADTAREIRSNKMGQGRIQNALQNNEAIKSGQMFFKNALKDIKSGKLYGNDIMDSFGEDTEDTDTIFGDMDDLFGDDETAGAQEVTFVDKSSKEDNGPTIRMINAQTEVQVQSAKATVDAMVSVGSSTIMKLNEIGSKVISQLSSIDSNLAAMVEYNNTNMTKFIEASIGYYQRMDKEEDTTDYSNRQLKGSDIYKDGGIDLKAYGKYIMQQAKAGVGETGAGGMLGMIMDNKDLLFAHPTEMILKMGIEAAIPNIVESTLKSFDESVKNVIPIVLDRIGRLDEIAPSTGILGSATRFIAKTFGVKREKKNEFDTSTFDKGPMQYNGVANHTIIEIIPKYLRESNVYLREIAQQVTGKDSKTLLGTATGFDWQTGKYKSVDEIEDSVYGSLADIVASRMQASAGGKALSGYRNNEALKTDAQKEEYDDALRNLLVKIEQVAQDGEIDFKNQDVVQSLFEGIKMDDVIKSVLQEGIKYLAENDNYAISTLNNAAIAASGDRVRQMQYMEKDPYLNGIFQIDNSEGGYQRYIQKVAAAGKIANVMPNANDATITNPAGIGEEENAPVPDRDRVMSGRKARTIRRSIRELTPASQEAEGGILGAISGFKGVLDGIAAGNSDVAFNNLMKTIGDVFTATANKFIEPLKKTLFGNKVGDSKYLDGGLLSGVNNMLHESIYKTRRMITGEGYTKADGGKVEDATEEEMGNTVMGKLKKITSGLKDGIMEKLFGKKDDKEDKKTGIVNTFLDGLVGWKHALLGTKSDTPEDIEAERKEVLANIKAKVEEVAPSAMTGSVVGGLIGTLVGGPFTGAILGAAGGILSKSKAFTTFLFGEEDENGEEIKKGLISKETQEFFKKNGNFIAGSSIVGAATGIFTGGGLLGTLIGGPMAGAVTGAATGMIMRTKAFQDFWYGNDEEGKVGLKTKITNWVKGFGADKEGNASGSKLGGMGIVGAAGGGMLGMLMGGPVVGAAIGLGSSILAQKDNFHEWLFGKVDEKTGAKREGVLGQFKNMLTAEVFNPIKNTFLDIKDDMGTFLKYDVFGKLSLALEPIGDWVSDTIHNIGSVVGKTATAAGNYIKKNFLENLVNVTKSVVAPVTAAASTIAKGVYSAGKALISAPINILYAVTSPIAQAIGGTVKAIAKTAFTAVDTFLVKPINKLVLEPLGGLVKFAANVISAPFTLLASTITNFSKFITRGIGRVGRFVSSIGTDIKTAILESGPVKWLRERKNDVKRFGVRIKTFVSSLFSPITEFAKSTIRAIGDSVKQTASNFVKRTLGLLNPMNWIRSGINLFYKMTGRDNPNKEPKTSRSGLLGYIGRKWEESKYGTGESPYERYVERDENGRIIKDNRTYAERRKSMASDKTTERLRKRDESDERKQHSANEKQIRKYTGNQRIADTSENRLLAEAEARKQGKVLNWGKYGPVMTEAEKKTLKDGENTATNTKNTVKKLDEILKFLKGESSDAETEANASKSGADIGNIAGANEIENLAKRERALKAKNTAIKNNDYVGMRDADKADKEAAAAAKSADEEERSQYRSTFDAVFKSQGIWAGLKTNFGKLRDSLRAKSEQHKRFADGTDNAEPGLSLVGEEGPEAVIDKSNRKTFRIVNGPQLMNMKGGEQVIPTSKLGADTTTVDATGEKDSNLLSTSDPTKLSIRSRVLRELLAIRMLISSKSGFGGKKKGGNKLPTVDSALDSLKPDGAGDEKPKGDSSDATWDEKSDEAMSEVNQLTGEAGRAQKEAEREAEEDDAREDAKVAELEGIKNATEGHAKNWTSIFGKAGLVTTLIIAAIPLIKKIWTTIKGIGSTIGNILGAIGGAVVTLGSNIVSNIADRYEWTEEANARTNGNTMSEQAEQEMQDLMDGNILTDANGDAHNGTSEFTTLIARTGLNVAKGALGATGGVLTSGAAKAQMAVGKGIADTAKSIGKAGSKVVEKVSATAASDTGSKLSKICQYIQKFFDFINEKFLAKFGKNCAKTTQEIQKVATEGIKNAGDDVVEEVATKTAETATTKGTTAGATLGLSEIAFATLGALNGASGTAKLFNVASDKVDGTMVAISAIFGALTSTTIGSIIDVILVFIDDIVGIDILNAVAVALYKLIKGSDSEEAQALDQHIDDFRNQYVAERDAKIAEQYNTQKQAGLIDESVTQEDFAAGVEDGMYSVTYDSFNDWNVKTNASILDNVVSGTVKGVKAVGSFLAGKDDSYYTDSSTGNTYKKNADGTYQISDSSGNDLGYVSGDAVDVSQFTKTTVKTGNVFQRVGKWMRKYLLDSTETRWQSMDGSCYYQSNGTTYDCYSKNGDLIASGLSAKDFEALMSSGAIAEDSSEQIDFKSKLTEKTEEWDAAINEAIENGWNATVEWASGVKEKASNLLEKAKTGVSDWLSSFKVDDKKVGWYCIDGTGYYQLQSNKTYSKYTLNGDLVAKNISQDDMDQLIDAGLVTQGEIKSNTAGQEAVKNITTTLNSLWKTASTGVTSTLKKIKNFFGGSGVGNSIVTMKSGTTVSSLAASTVTGGSGKGIAGGRGSEPSTLNGSTYYAQNDSRWGDDKFVRSDGVDDGATIADTGCGPTAMSMVVSDIRKKNVTPVEMAKVAQATGTRDETGTNWGFINSAASIYGLDSEMSLAPSADYVNANLENGNPMILSGQDDGSGNSPYTSTGHYVVAVGKDSAGNVIINDPRGSSYSGKKNLSDVLNSTGAAWAFGSSGAGRRRKNNAIKFLYGGSSGTGVTSADVIAIATDEIGYLGKADASNLDVKAGSGLGSNKYTKYARDLGYTNNQNWCAMFVSWCIYKAANNAKNIANEVLCGSISASCTTLKKAFVSEGRWSDYSNTPQPGDLIFYNEDGNKTANPTHIGIVISVDSDGKITTVEGNTSYNTYTTAVGSHTFVKTYKKIQGFGRPKYDSTSNYSGSSTSSTGSSGLLDIVSNVSSVISAMGTAALNAVLTGDFSTDWKSVINNALYGDDDDAAATIDSEGLRTSDDGLVADENIDSSNSASYIWKQLKAEGYTDAGVAGLMGNLYAESSMRAGNLQDDYNKSLNITDDEYTAQVNTGLGMTDPDGGWSYSDKSMSKDTFIGDSAGYGLAQWTTKGRKRGLWDKAKSMKTGINGVGMQTKYLIDELTGGSYNVVNNTLQNATSVRQASDAVLTKFEIPEDQSESVKELRAKYGKTYYDKYAGGSGEGPSITNKRYRFNTNGGFGDTVIPEKVTHRSPNTTRSIGNVIRTVTGGSGDGVTMEALLSKMVELLTVISGNSDNLTLLKDIKTKLSTTSTVYSPQTTNNIITGGGRGDSASTNKKSTNTTSKPYNPSTSMSTAEMTARKIAFGI